MVNGAGSLRDQVVGCACCVEGLEAQAALEAGQSRRDIATALGERAEIGRRRIGRIREHARRVAAATHAEEHIGDLPHHLCLLAPPREGDQLDRTAAPRDGPPTVHQIDLVRFARAARDRVHADEVPVPDPLEVPGVAEDAHGPDATSRRRIQSNAGRWVDLRRHTSYPIKLDACHILTPTTRGCAFISAKAATQVAMIRASDSVRYAGR